jgi:hypothetical protein
MTRVDFTDKELEMISHDVEENYRFGENLLEKLQQRLPDKLKWKENIINRQRTREDILKKIGGLYAQGSLS